MTGMNKPGDKLLAIPPACCCNSLNSQSSFSPWNSNALQKARRHSEKCHKLLFEMEDLLPSHNSKVFTSPKHSFTSTSSDSRNLLIANSKLFSKCKIPYPFSHQSPSAAIKDYCVTHTYPALQRRVSSAHAAETSSHSRRYSLSSSPCNYKYARSISEPQITTALKPKTLVLEEYRISGSNRGTINQRRLSMEVSPSPRIISGRNHSKTEGGGGGGGRGDKSTAVADKRSTPPSRLKMKWTSHPQLPSFIIKPSKSVNDYSDKILRRHTSLKANHEHSRRASSAKDGKYKMIAQAVCNVVPPEGTKLRVQNPIQGIKYCYSPRTRAKLALDESERLAVASRHSKNGPSSITITSPWESHDHR